MNKPIDLTRLVFDRLHAAGTPDMVARQRIYQQCRADVEAMCDEAALQPMLEQLEKIIRRQEMQAIYEESLSG